MTPPLATVTPSHRMLRWWSWLVEPPRWASSLFSWAMSGAFAGAVGNILAIMHRRGSLADLTMVNSLGVAAGAALGLLLLFMPFLLAGMLFGSLRRRTPRAGALWMLALHVPAHIVAFSMFLGMPLVTNLEVPLLVGGLWGLWLPRIDLVEARQHSLGEQLARHRRPTAAPPRPGDGGPAPDR